MTRLLIALIPGIWLAAQFTRLPSMTASVLVIAVGLVGICFRDLRIPACIIMGVGWGLLQGGDRLNAVIPESWEGKDLLIEVRIDDLPQVNLRGQRWTVEVLRILNAQELPECQIESKPNPCSKSYRLILNVYQPLESRPEQIWRLQVRVNRPRGQVNRSGNDYQAWLLRQAVGGTGYVRSSPPPLLIGSARPIFSIPSLRFRLRERIAYLLPDSPRLGIITALTLGDSHLIPRYQWRLLKDTGTVHLMVISGLHLGIVASFSYLLLSRCCTLLFSLHWSRWITQCLSGLLVTAYALVAGLGLSVQRALIMVLVGQICILLLHRISPIHLLVLAMIAILLNDTLAFESNGFWLSFGAVVVLLYSFAGKSATTDGLLCRTGRVLQAQLAILIGMFVLTGFILTQVSLVSLPANLVAVPVIELVIVPGLLLASLIHLISPGPAGFLYVLLDRILELLLNYLQMLSATSLTWVPASMSTASVLLGCTGGLILLMPRGIPGRWLGLVLLIPILNGSGRELDEGQLQVSVLDVGQGLAVLMRTRHHTLLYDAGARYGDGFDFGDAVVVPAIRRSGIRQIDKLLISNSDIDHAGGISAVISALPVWELTGGTPRKIETLINRRRLVKQCQAGQRWRWDSVYFEILHPDADLKGSGNTNNDSCVLLVRTGSRKLLIPGDIEAAAESRLQQLGQVDVLLVPHHGSYSSSTPRLLNRVNPSYAIISAGFMNRFQHPDSRVLLRYQLRGSMVFNTATSGEINFLLQDQYPLAFKQARINYRRYWFQ